MKSTEKQVPNSLRVWFVIHFIVDMLFAIPLLFFPEFLMPLLGWDVVDPVMSRLVGAAILLCLAWWVQPCWVSAVNPCWAGTPAGKSFQPC